MDVCHTPLLLIIFKRHASLVAQIDILRSIRPVKLYVFADGPSHADDVADCTQARSALQYIDWPCNLHTRFLDTNLGCGKGPAAAMDWFFANETEGIILEDDLLPYPDFFRFCAEMLERFRDDERVMDVCGTNRLGRWGNGDQSYYYSQWGSSCGWATWRRAWRNFDYTVRSWADLRIRFVTRDVYRHPLHYAFFARILDQTFRGGSHVSWWDYQWAFAKNLNNGLSIVPATNLVHNVGCDRHSNHDRDPAHTIAAPNDPEGIGFPLRHPPYIRPDRDFDDALLKKAIPFRHYLSSLLPWRIKQLLKKFIRRPGEEAEWIQ